MQKKQKIAKRIKNLTDKYRGVAYLYQLSEPVSSIDGSDKEYETNYVVASAIYAPLSGPETHIFPSDKDGKVIVWSELEGSVRGELDPDQAIQRSGYELVSPLISKSEFKLGNYEYVQSAEFKPGNIVRLTEMGVMSSTIMVDEKEFNLEHNLFHSKEYNAETNFLLLKTPMIEKKYNLLVVDLLAGDKNLKLSFDSKLVGNINKIITKIA